MNLQAARAFQATLLDSFIDDVLTKLVGASQGMDSGGCACPWAICTPPPLN